MSNESQTTDQLEEFGRGRFARLVGTLVLCGADQAAAVRLVESTLQRAVSGGLVGGREMPRLLEDEVLDRARPPVAAKIATDDVERAVAALAWPDRIATVASLVLRNPRLGLGRPEEVARVLGAHDDDPARPALTTMLTDAVDLRGVDPDPLLFQRVTRTARFRWISIAGITLAALAVLAVIIGLALRRSPDDASTTGTTVAANRQWIAVLDVAPTSFALAPQAAEVNRVASGSVFTNRWDCYDGVPADAPRARGDWILVIAAPDKDALDALVTTVARPVVLEVSTHDSCRPATTTTKAPATSPPASTGPVTSK